LFVLLRVRPNSIDDVICSPWVWSASSWGEGLSAVTAIDTPSSRYWALDRR
jgi:hypothetical protein